MVGGVGVIWWSGDDVTVVYMYISLLCWVCIKLC